jgi:hypothetical protein
MLDEATKARRQGDLPACTGYYARVLGLLCANHVRLQIGARRPLPLALAAERWNLRMTRAHHVAAGAPPQRGAGT